MKCKHKNKVENDKSENKSFFHQENEKMWLKRFLQRDDTVKTIHRKT